MILGLISSTLLLIAVFGAVGRSLETGEWEGFITLGSGGDCFKPCGSRDMWWLRNKDFKRLVEDLKKDYGRIAERPYAQVYVRLSGEVSKKGQFGPLGAYQRVVYVEEVLEIRAKQETDCAKA